MTKEKYSRAIKIFLVSFCGFGIFTLLSSLFEASLEINLVVASYDATSVVLCSLPDRNIAHPKNVILGHFLSAIVGVLCRISIEPFSLTLAIVLSVSLSIFAMELTDTVHPPGGAIALIGVIGSDEVVGNGLRFVMITATTGAALYYFIFYAIRKVMPT